VTREKLYSVTVRVGVDDGRRTGPQLDTYDAVVTPNRIAIYEEGRTRGAMHYAPAHLPSHYAWTVEGAWERFQAAWRRRLQQLDADRAEVADDLVRAEQVLHELRSAGGGQ